MECIFTPKRWSALSTKFRRALPGFFIGRYDIRYENEEDFKHGLNFQIVELNGATSEATSIYDPRNSLFSAYRTLFRQWRLVFAIGASNRANGHAPYVTRDTLAQLAAIFRHCAIVSVG